MRRAAGHSDVSPLGALAGDAGASVGWTARDGGDVPPYDGWLSARERDVLAGLASPRRRADWRLGRWIAKAAVGAWLDVDPQRVEVFAAPDGAPEPWLDGAPAPVSLSLSHRAGRAVAAVAGAPAVVGCDLERVEPRSPAFLADWLAPSEAALLRRPGADREMLANLCWAAKEAASKARREGLRLDLRSLEARPVLGGPGGAWLPLAVGDLHGWWREEPGWVIALVGGPPPAVPRAL